MMTPCEDIKPQVVCKDGDTSIMVRSHLFLVFGITLWGSGEDMLNMQVGIKLGLLNLVFSIWGF